MGSIILVFLTRPHRFVIVIVTIDIDRNGFTTSVVLMLIIVPKIKNVIKKLFFLSNES